MRYPLFHACGAALLLAGCASAPADRGWREVQALAQARGFDAGAAPAAPDPNADPNADAIGDETRSILATPLTATSAVRVAFLHSPRVASEYAQLGLSSAELIGASRLANPVLSGSGQHSSRRDDAARYDFGLSESFIGLLMLPARSRLAADAFERAQLDTTQALLRLAADVQTDYFAAVGAQQILAMRETVAEAADAAAELAERMHQAGNLSALDRAALKAAASEARLDAEKSQVDLALAQAALNRTMGLPADARWRLAGTLPAPPAAEDDPTTLRQLAQTQRADLEAERRNERALDAAYDTARRLRWFGEFELGLAYERDTDRAQLLGPSFSLQLPLFSQGQDTVLRAASRRELVQAGRRAKEREIDNAVDAAVARLRAARQRIRRLREETIPLRETVVEQTQQRVDAMLVGVFELLRARQQEYEAYQQYLEAVRDYWLARTELSLAVGGRLPSDGGLAVSADPSPGLPATDGPLEHAPQTQPAAGAQP